MLILGQIIATAYLAGLHLLPKQFRQERAAPDTADYITLGGVSPMIARENEATLIAGQGRKFSIGDDEEDQDTKPLLSEP